MKYGFLTFFAAFFIAATASAQSDAGRYEDMYGKAHPLLIPADISDSANERALTFDKDNAMVKTPLVLTVKTNMLYDAALTLDGGLELAIGDDWSVGADGYVAWLSLNRHHAWYQHYGFDVYGRYWFGGQHTSQLTGWHAGAYLGTFTYDWYPESTGYQSPDMFKTFRIGVEIGWSKQIARNWSIDFYGGVGFFHTWQKLYKPNIDHGYHLIGTRYRNLPDFTRFGITIGYTFGERR